MKLIRAGRYEEALEGGRHLLAQMPETHPYRSEAEAMQRAIAMKRQLRDEAAARFEVAMAQGLDPADAWADRAEVLLELELFDEATQGFQKALELNPDSARAWHGLGAVKTERDLAGGPVEGQEFFAAEAQECFRRSLALAPDSEAAWFRKGQALSDGKDRDGALVCFNHILEQINPESPWAWYAKGLELEANGAAEEAVICYVKALQLDPDQESAWSCHEVRLQTNT